jgi:type IV pilus assembly protein PilB
MAGDAERDRAIAQSLLRQGIIDREQLTAAEAQQKAGNLTLVQALLRLGACTAQDLARAAGTATGPSQGGGFVLAHSASVADGAPEVVGGASLDDYEVDPQALREVPRTVAEEYTLLPLQVSEGRILLAMADPDNVFAIDEVRKRTGRRVEAVQVPEADLIAAIDQYYSTQARAAVAHSGAVVTRDLGGSLSKDSTLGDFGDDELAATVDEAPVVRLVEKMIRDAVAQRASDIHIEPRSDTFALRFRVDGLLQTITELPIDLHRTVVSRLKILGGADISENRMPQDGRFATLVDDRPIDIRLSTLPTYWGEKIVLRLLDKSAALVSLSQLGLLPDMMKQYDQLLHARQGMVLVTGPTGSGKSTTLYASLHKIKDDTLNITTVEDPIEYEVEGVNQTQVHARIELSFARCLRHILRQDPDIILIGEVRDYETAEMAFRAALTGHLVLSTLHTNDAPSAATRLIDMKVEPYLIASCVLGVLAQRLVRRLCTRCREQYEPSELEIEELHLKPDQSQKLRFFRGRGCEQCRNTGHYGRVGLYELMAMTNEVRDLIVRHANAAELRQAAVRGGMKTMRYDGLSKINAGVTSASEVIRVMLMGEED